MTITRGTYVDALDANLNELYQEGIESWKEEYSKFMNVGTSDKQSEKDSYVSGFAEMPEKAEGVAATYDTPIAGITKTYSHVTYALGYEITEEAVEDNLKAPETFNKLPQALVRSGIETVETKAMSVINEGYSTTTGFDGQYLFATEHPMLDSSTQANTPSTAADLSISSLSAAITAMESFTDDRGLKWPCKPNLLVVPTALWITAEELLGSEFKPYTANNEVNALMKKDLQYMVSHYMTDSDSWAILSDKGRHFLKFFWRVKLGALKRGADFDTTNLKHLARMRFSCGYSHWLGTYGSAGA